MPTRGRTNIKWDYFFITTTVVNFANIFRDSNACDLLIKNILYYQNQYKFNILAYVIMPSHLHWIIEINNKICSVSDIMRDIKKFSAWDIMEYLENNNSEYLLLFKREARIYKDQKRKFWTKRFHDEAIRNEKMLWTKLHYIHNNPVKASLVEKPTDYRYSSARNYVLNDHSVIKIDTSLAGIEIK